jgi:rhodanese-related sulfurtransferase
MKRILSCLALSCLLIPALAVAAGGPDASVPPDKQTTLGLYLTAAEAYEKWKADPEGVKILDVRTPDEWLFVGHAEMAWNVPFMLQQYRWDDSGKKLRMTPNPDFLAGVTALFKPADTVLVMCRSGNRSAPAVNAMAKAGFTHVYNVIDGMEGDLVNDPASPDHGKRMKNGWKNAGLPWTYALDPAKMRLPAAAN